MRHFPIFFILLTLVSCIDQPKMSRGNLTTSNTSGGATPAEITWNYLGALTNSIRINYANQNVAYLAGTDVESFLSTVSSEQEFCLVTNYLAAGVSYEQRYRAVPLSFYDFDQKKSVKLLRVDFVDVTNSQEICSGHLATLDANEAYSITTYVLPMALSYFDPSKMCLLCTSILNSKNLNLYDSQLDAGSGIRTLYQVSKTKVDLTTLSMTVDPNNNPLTTTNSCTKSECVTKGYDCCIDNQCVKDGGIRSSAYSAAYVTQLQTVEFEKADNPLVYLLHPELYYICGSAVPNVITE